MEKREKLIVMPLTPAKGQKDTGTGLGVHFFLGNIMVLQDRLSEFWFGWRVNKLFPEKEMLQSYCLGKSHGFDIPATGKEQGIRYWLSGRYQLAPESVHVMLTLTDTVNCKADSCTLQMNVRDCFCTFYPSFFSWLDSCGLPFSSQQAAKASWPEKIDVTGLNLLGRAVETTYLHYITASDPGSKITTVAYEKSVAAAPCSFLAHDLYAWALYKNGEYDRAVRSFHRSLKYNENGFGALAGLMWCAIAQKKKTKAQKYALAKAGIRNDDPEKANAFIEKKFRQIS